MRAQSTLLLRAWALNPVTMRQMQQHLSAHADEQTQDSRNEHRRIAVSPTLSRAIIRHCRHEKQ